MFILYSLYIPPMICIATLHFIQYYFMECYDKLRQLLTSSKEIFQIALVEGQSMIIVPDLSVISHCWLCGRKSIRPIKKIE